MTWVSHLEGVEIPNEMVAIVLLGLRNFFGIWFVFGVDTFLHAEFLFSHSIYIELVGWRSRDECFINVSGNGRTEGEHQHSLRVNYTRVPLVHQCNQCQFQ